MMMMIALHVLLVEILLLLLLLFLLLFVILLLLLLLGLNCSIVKCIHSGISSTSNASCSRRNSFTLLASFAHFFLLLEALLMPV